MHVTLPLDKMSHIYLGIVLLTRGNLTEYIFFHFIVEDWKKIL